MEFLKFVDCWASPNLLRYLEAVVAVFQYAVVCLDRLDRLSSDDVDAT